MIALHPMEDFLADIEPTRPPGRVSLFDLQARAANRIMKTRQKRSREQECRAVEPEVSSDGGEELGLELELGDAPGMCGSQADNCEEPCCFQDGILSGEQATAQTPVLGFLTVAGLAEDQENSAVWSLLLSQRAVTSTCGQAPEVMQALFATVSSSDSLQAQAACEELSSSYEAAKAGADGLWMPSIPDFLQRMLQLGYTEPCSSSGGSGSTAHSGKANADRSAKEPSEGSALPHRSPHGLKLTLLLIIQLCQLHLEGFKSWDFSKHKAEARQLLLAVNFMRLDPALLNALSPQLSRCRELLIEAWVHVHEPSYRAVELEVARSLASAGPSHRAALRVLNCRVGCSVQLQKLSQAAAIALLEQLLERKVELSLRQSNFLDALKQLLGEVGHVPRLMEAMKVPQPQPSDAKEGAGAGTSASTATDYWRLTTTIQAADAVMWPLQVAGQISDADCCWWSAYLRALDDKLGKARQAAPVRRLLSSIKNHYEFMRM